MPIYKVVLSGTCYAALQQNTLHFQSQTNQTEQDVATAINTHWVENVRQPLTNQTQFLNISVTKLDVPLAGAFSLPIQKTGAQGGNEQMIPFVCWKIRKLTGLAGRKFRGRFYVGPIQGGFTSFGLVNGAGIAHWNLTLIALRTKFVTAVETGLQLIIRGDGPNPHNTPVTDLQLSTQVGVQRRRNIGVGA